MGQRPVHRQSRSALGPYRAGLWLPEQPRGWRSSDGNVDASGHDAERAHLPAAGTRVLLVVLLWSPCVLPFTGTLREANGRYELNRPLQDFYDTALVLTRAGESAPRLVTV